MRQVLLACVIAGVALLSVPLSAHHSYGAYDRTHTVSLTGTVRAFSWKNPHALVELSPDDGAPYVIELGSVYYLEYMGFSPATLKPGDRVEIVGYVMRDETQRRMSLVQSVRRVKDGWQWKRPAPYSAPSGT